MSYLDELDPQDWSTIISQIMKQAGLTVLKIYFDDIDKEARTDRHAVEMRFYDDHYYLRRLTLAEARAMQLEAAPGSLAVYDRNPKKDPPIH